MPPRYLTALRRALLAAAVFIAPNVARAQSATPRDTASRDATLAVFLDCGFDCDADFVRTQITYVNWVRERTASDVHVLVTSQATGGGGSEYTLAFLGQRRFAGVGDTLRFVTPQGSTSDETRRGLTRTLGQGLVRFVARTPLGSRLVVTLGAPPAGAPKNAGQSRRDPWNLWVYSVGTNMSTNGERSSRFLSLSGNASARRTTDRWKLSLTAVQNYNTSRFDLGDGDVSKFIRRSTDLSGLAVKSLGPPLVGRPAHLARHVDVREQELLLARHAGGGVRRVPVPRVDAAHAHGAVRDRRRVVQVS